MVHNAGGLSCVEGFALGVPVIGYNCLPGHGHRNSLAMQQAGVAADATSETELVREIRRLSRTQDGADMVARARGMFLTDPTDELLELAHAPVTVPQRSAARTWTTRAAAVAAGVPLSVTALSFGVAQASVHGVGVANSKDGVYVAALVDHDQVASARVLSALRRYDTTVAVRHHADDLTASAPTPTDVQSLVAHGISVVGADTGVHSRNPRTLKDSMVNAAQAASYASGQRLQVVCLKAPGLVEWTVARDRAVQLTLSKVVVRDGVLPTALHLGDVVLLDERGRTPGQVEGDLRGLTALAASEVLPQRPLVDVFRADES
jgi:hypothetical protein